MAQRGAPGVILRRVNVASLYDPRFEHDACGVGFVARLDGRPTHGIVDAGLTALERLEHRGATGAEPDTGDGAGILLQIPHQLFSRECALGRVASQDDGRPLADLPPPGQYAVGLFFGSSDAQATALAKLVFAMIVRQEGLRVLGWRRVPTDNRTIGKTARSVEPTMDHVFVGMGTEPLAADVLERKLYVVRKRYERAIRSSGIDDRQYFHIPTLSCRTLVYKGMLTPPQLREYFGDLSDPRTESALAVFHSRFSTNTFPSWELAHPYHLVAHNGEINTLRGNLGWMRAREALLSSDLLGSDIERIFPIVNEGLSDSACFDSVLELLVMAGRSLPHAIMMMVPEAWEHDDTMGAELRAFYAYHGCLIEPWDGPACVTFTDGLRVGAVLDRNGLRPGRYVVTDDGIVLCASETGVLDVPPERIVEKGRLGPGRIFYVDLEQGRIVPDAELKHEIASARPYASWLEEHLVPLERLPEADAPPRATGEELDRALTAFGYTEEELRVLIAPMATRAEEPLGSMGNDAALAVLSKKARPLFDCFQQLFAQVTNPPLDAIREKIVTSLATAVGPEGNLLDPRPESCRLVLCEGPFLDNRELARFRRIAHFGSGQLGGAPGSSAFPVAPSSPPQGATLVGGEPFGVTMLDMTFPANEGADGLEPALLSLFAKAERAIANGAKVLVLTDRTVSESRAPIPALLAVAGLQNHLVREKKRMLVTLIVETAAVREVHHAAMLIGYGASAVNPYLALDALTRLESLGLVPPGTPIDELEQRYLKAIEKGVVKVMSKMGISTIASYRGAQIFEAVGLAPDLVKRYFTGTPSRIGGIGAKEIAEDVLHHHARAFVTKKPADLEVGGQYQFRRQGEVHLFGPETIYKLQHATRAKKIEIFREYSRTIDDDAAKKGTLRGQLRIRSEATRPIPIEEVEPIERILSRFATGAMSYGSISAEAHETLAIAMNRIGGRSNSGEGGEDPKRFHPDANGDSRNSAITQVASARFGVTSAYLTRADELQIKIAQGVKPGEGGQLPGNKVYPHIARVRHSTPGVPLISPPPHHDIYSIEDLSQLIYDLKSANPRARISVKLVSEVGVGTVAAGVAKAKSDVVLVSGHDGGTGASPLTSVKHAGAPWELGLAEAQQTLVMNRLRDRVVLQVDGQLKTARDVVVAALLGAEEFGFATAPLVVMGCVMMRVCHLDTCPVGIATQNPELRARFTGKAEHVIAFFRFLAEEVRALLASLGARSLDEIVGRVDLLAAAPSDEVPRSKLLALGAILDATHLAAGGPLHAASRAAAAPAPRPIDQRMIELAEPAVFDGTPVRARLKITNRDRAVGTMLGNAVTRRRGDAGLPDDTIVFELEGSAGQSLGAFLPRGVTLLAEGDANDYVGKGLSGGRIAVFPPRGASFDASRQVIAGNVVLYGATDGEAFFCGRAGERFAVRNSGARAVVEGIGDHGCEYMTGGIVVVLGPTGRNFAAGMSGGVAFVLDSNDQLDARTNHEMVGLQTPTEDDLNLIKALVERHVAATKSALAQSVLTSWSEQARKFVKVMPFDFEKAILDGRVSSPPLSLAPAAE